MDEKTVTPADSTRFASRVCLGVAIACSLLAIPYILFSQHVMTLTYAGFQISQLPVATTVALQPFFVWIFPVLALLGLVKEVLVASRTKALFLNISLCLAVFLVLLLYSAALQLPLYVIVTPLK